MGDQAKFITVPLQLLVSWLTEMTAHLVGIGVLRDGVQLFDPSGTYRYEVAAACSGIRSLIAIFLLATVYGFITFCSRRNRLFIMALAFPLAVLGNLARMLLIIVTAELGGQEAGNYVHENSFFSLVPYIPAIIGLLVVGRLMEKRCGSDTSVEQRHP